MLSSAPRAHGIFSRFSLLSVESPMAKRKRITVPTAPDITYRYRKPKRNFQMRRAKPNLPPAFSTVHLDAAGIDIGAESHFVAVPADRDEQPVREFGAFTGDLH
jgi:hypothetical protein